MAWYDRTTRFVIGAPPQTVYDVLVAPEDFLAHWDRVSGVERLVAGAPDGSGRVHRGSIRAALPYTLTWSMTTVRVEPPWLIEWEARGDLEGHGLWRMRPLTSGPAWTEAGEAVGLDGANDAAGSDGAGEATEVRFRWQVRTTTAWMNLVAPLGRRALLWSHDRAMRDGARALARYLDAPLSRLEFR